MKKDKIAVEALSEKREKLRAEIINLAGRCELETNAKTKEAMIETLNELREKSEKISIMLKEYGG